MNSNEVSLELTSTTVSLFGSGIAGHQDGPASNATFDNPSGVAIDSQGNIYVADTQNSAIRKINTSGYVSTLPLRPSNTVSKRSLDTIALLQYPVGILIDSKDNLYITDHGDSTIKFINTTSNGLTTIAGSGLSDSNDGNLLLASFYLPTGLALLNGNIYFVDTGNFLIRKIDMFQVATYAGKGNSSVCDSQNDASCFKVPTGIASGSNGTIYVCDSGNNVIKKINANGKVSVVTISNDSNTTLNNPTSKIREIKPFESLIPLDKSQHFPFHHHQQSKRFKRKLWFLI